jgi:hypothetical protein
MQKSPANIARQKGHEKNGRGNIERGTVVNDVKEEDKRGASPFVPAIGQTPGLECIVGGAV